MATPNEDPEEVLNFLHQKDAYQSLGFILHDIDFTLDYSGTFDKAEVIDHLLYNRYFRMAHSLDAGSKTIVDNDMTVGRNCLSWMEDVSFIFYQLSPYMYTMLCRY